MSICAQGEGEGRRRSFGGVLGFNTLCRGCLSHITLLDCCILKEKSQRKFAHDRQNALLVDVAIKILLKKIISHFLNAMSAFKL